MNSQMNLHSRNQSGAALIVVLLLLVIITLLGLASMRGALMQERMAASTAARAIAFQAAESGLRQAEVIARDSTTATSFPASGCSNGYCANPVTTGTTTLVGDSSFWAGNNGYRTGTAIGSGVSAIAPKFVIEDNGSAAATSSTPGNASGPIGCNRGGNCDNASSTTRQSVYRITAYAQVPNGGEVILQSVYKH